MSTVKDPRIRKRATSSRPCTRDYVNDDDDCNFIGRLRSTWTAAHNDSLAHLAGRGCGWPAAHAFFPSSRRWTPETWPPKSGSATRRRGNTFSRVSSMTDGTTGWCVSRCACVSDSTVLPLWSAPRPSNFTICATVR